MRAFSSSILLILLFIGAIWSSDVLAQHGEEFPTMLLKKESSKNISIELMAPRSNKIDFNASLVNCVGEKPYVNVKYSYSDGCNMMMNWTPEQFYTIKDGLTDARILQTSSRNLLVQIEKSEASFQAPNKIGTFNAACNVENVKQSDKTGYLLKFIMWRTEDLKCDVKLTFNSYYTVATTMATTIANTMAASMATTSTIASKMSPMEEKRADDREGGVSWTTIGLIFAIDVAFLLLSLVTSIIVYLCCRKNLHNESNKNRSPSSPKRFSCSTVTRAPIEKPYQTANDLSLEKTPDTDVEWRKKDSMNKVKPAVGVNKAQSAVEMNKVKPAVEMNKEMKRLEKNRALMNHEYEPINFNA